MTTTHPVSPVAKQMANDQVAWEFSFGDIGGLTGAMDSSNPYTRVGRVTARWPWLC